MNWSDILNWSKNKLDYHIYPEKDDIEFIDDIGSFAPYELTSIKLARDVDVLCKEHQIKNLQEFTFAKCPGLLEYSRIGYIVPAWSMIRIKANKAATVSYDKCLHPQAKLAHSLEFNQKIVDGLVENHTANPQRVFKYPSPWRIRTNPGISLMILPALYHNAVFQKLFFYPGIVHYDNFTSLNAVFTPTHHGEVVINTGDPLLHVIPVKVDNFSANYGAKYDYDYVPVLDSHPQQFTKSWYARFCRKTMAKFKLKKVENKKKNG